jgi:hypothetical protein
MDRKENDASINSIVACISCSGNVFTEPLPSNDREEYTYRHINWWEGFKKYAVGMGTGAVISILRTGSGIQKLIREVGYTDTHAPLWSRYPNLFFENKESRLKWTQFYYISLNSLDEKMRDMNRKFTVLCLKWHVGPQSCIKLSIWPAVPASGCVWKQEPCVGVALLSGSILCVRACVFDWGLAWSISKCVLPFLIAVVKVGSAYGLRFLFRGRPRSRLRCCWFRQLLNEVRLCCRRARWLWVFIQEGDCCSLFRFWRYWVK